MLVKEARKGEEPLSPERAEKMKKDIGAETSAKPKTKLEEYKNMARGFYNKAKAKAGTGAERAKGAYNSASSAVKNTAKGFGAKFNAMSPKGKAGVLAAAAAALAGSAYAAKKFSQKKGQ